MSTKVGGSVPNGPSPLDLLQTENSKLREELTIMTGKRDVAVSTLELAQGNKVAAQKALAIACKELAAIKGEQKPVKYEARMRSVGGLAWFEISADEYKKDWPEEYETRELYLRPAPQGEVVVTKNQLGQIVAVTRQDAEGNVLSVIAESGVLEGWQLVPKYPTPSMIGAGCVHRESAEFTGIKSTYIAMLAAAPTPTEEGNKCS